MTTAILGSGPAGLLAAYACYSRGEPASIFSHPVKSRLGGAQFLHEPIPGLTTDSPQQLRYTLYGDPAVYQQKVYGDNPNVRFVSMSFLKDGQLVPCWSLRDVYDGLWEKFQGQINPVDINPIWLRDEAERFDRVVVAMPLDSICLPWSNHEFHRHQVQIHNHNISYLPSNTIVYEGTKNKSWYRQSRIFGVGSTEYGMGVSPPGLDLVTITKPLFTNCSCWPDFIRVGRYGKWSKGVLAHDGYQTMMEALS